MNPGMAAKVKPIPIPAKPATTNASHKARCSMAKNSMVAAKTTEPKGIMLRIAEASHVGRQAATGQEGPDGEGDEHQARDQDGAPNP